MPDGPRLTLPVTVIVSLLVSVAGASATAAWWWYDLRSIVATLEKQQAETALQVARLYKALQEDRPSAEVSGPINTGTGLKCDAGYAIARISLSSQDWGGSVTCVPIRPDLR